jgi:hypothetical protein
MLPNKTGWKRVLETSPDAVPVAAVESAPLGSCRDRRRGETGASKPRWARIAKYASKQVFFRRPATLDLLTP